MDRAPPAVAHVIGSINRDIVAFVGRLPRPGETVLGTRGAFFPGGKGANQAVAVVRLGGACRLVGRIGADAFGTEMRAFLDAEGVNTSDVTTVGDVATGIALITVDARGENCITVVPGANLAWADGVPRLNIAANDVVVCQLEIPLTVVVGAFVQARAAGARTVLNPAPFQALPPDLLALTDVLVLNETELAALLDIDAEIDPENLDVMGGYVESVLERGPRMVIVTLGAMGVFVQARGLAPLRIAGRRVAARDATGAGDCFVGAFVSALLRGRDGNAAAAFANAAAALSVTGDGAAASYPRLSDVDAWL